MFQEPNVESSLRQCADNVRTKQDRKMRCRGIGFATPVGPISQPRLVLFGSKENNHHAQELLDKMRLKLVDSMGE